MAITSAGYAGTVDAQQWARMSRYFGMAYAVRDAAALACTQTSGAKSFRIAAGEFYGRGVMDASDAVTTLAPTVPASGGQWFLVVARRVWATKSTTFQLIAGATTSAVVPTLPPATLPGTLSANPGTQDDQPLFWTWVNASNLNTAIFDLRDLPIEAVNSIPVAARAYRSVTTGVVGAVAVDTITSQQGGVFLEAGGLRVPRAGTYLIILRGDVTDASAAAFRTLQIEVNGSSIARTAERLPLSAESGSSTRKMGMVAVQERLAAGDRVGGNLGGSTAPNSINAFVLDLVRITT